MPQVSAALVRSAPSKTIASANIRRDAALSFSRPAAARSSMAVKSLRVTAIAAIVLAPHHTKSSSIQTFSDSGTPTSHPFSPLVSFVGSVVDRSRAMESATFRKWLVEQGCRIDGDEHPRGHEGQVMVTVHREARKTRVPLGGSRQSLDPRVVQRACEELGLDPSQLPGPKSRV